MTVELSDEQVLIRDSVRAFAEKRLAPRVLENDRAERFDIEIAREIAKLGFVGSTVPVEWGGGGLDYVSYGLILEELGRIDSSTRTVVSVGTSLVSGSIARWGSDEQKARWLVPICAGDAFGCFGLTEPDSGSDAAGMRTRAVRSGDGWEISGQKMWISLGSVADVALIFAKADPDARNGGITCFLVPTDTSGFQAHKLDGKLGLRSSDVAELSLDAVHVGDDARLGDVGQGFAVAMSALASGRFGVAAGAVGICQASLEHAVRYATERHQFGRPIASFQLVQSLLAEIAVDTQAARMLVRQAAELKDAGKTNTLETSIAKLFATEAAIRCASRAIQVHGGAGYVDSHPVERLWRDARVTTLYEGTSQVQQLIIGRELTGINAMTA